jgi:CRISPR-associated protein Cmr1
MQIKFKTLTPIWTGGVCRNSDRLRETGIMGSLRWWYEGIVRAMGGYACDPTETTCIVKTNSGDGKDEICPACKFFGATGWKRRFRLEMSGLNSLPLFFKASPSVYETAGNWLWLMFGEKDSGGKRIGKGLQKKFIFTSSSLWADNGLLNLFPTGLDSEETKARFAFLLHIVTNYGGLGAKTQNGFGQIQLIHPFGDQILEQGRRLILNDVKLKGEKYKKESGRFFNLRQFFCREYELKNIDKYLTGLKEIGEKGSDFHNNCFVPCSFDIRYKNRQKNPFTGQGRNFGMRPWFRQRWGKSATDLLFGKSEAKSESDRSAGKINVSHIYKNSFGAAWKLKVWGYVPETVESEDKKKKGLKSVEQEVDAFIMGDSGMFPESRVVSKFDFREIMKE